MRMGWLTLAAIAMIGCSAAHGQTLERVLMPGPVIADHAEYEDECTSCHQPFSKDSQRDLCLDCHEEITEDLIGQMGFHGKSASIAELECAACHTEHEGRDADVVGLDPDTFDHDRTDFPLYDSHLTVPCERCHSTDALYRETEGTCFACHETEDPHKGNLGKACGD